MLRLGISYSSDEAQGFAAVGHPQVAAQFANYVQTLKSGYQIGINDLNAHGGLAGCKVQAVYHDFSSLAADGFDGESQKECTDFAQDQHAFAVFPGALEDKVLLTCLAQAKVPVFWDVTTYNPTAADFARYRGYLYQPTGIVPDRWGPFMSDLDKAGYFGSGAKVGILLADNGSGNNQALVNDVWKPQLAAMHIPVTVFTYSQIDSFASVSDVGSQFSSAVLQFKVAGVNRVLLTPDGGDGLIFFTAAAESQGYHPHYGLTSDSAPAGMTAAPSDQAVGSMAVSWSTTDLLSLTSGSNPIPGIGTSPVRTHCDQLYSGFARANSEPVVSFYSFCDFLASLQSALAKAPAPTVPALLAGMESLGSSFDSASGYGPSRLEANHDDGGTAVRVLQWSGTTKAFVPATPPEATP